MSFDEVQFPASISYGSSGGAQFHTDIVMSQSGYERRNINWSQARHQYNARNAVKSPEQIAEIVNFFMARQGRARGFRYKDWGDYATTDTHITNDGSQVSALDVQIGTGDASAVDFQLIKKYTNGSVTYTRDIKKPVSGTVKVSVNDVEKTITTDFTVDYTTGVVSFVSAPPLGHSVKAGFEFDVPVRFETDFIDKRHSAFLSGEVDLPMMEIRI